MAIALFGLLLYPFSTAKEADMSGYVNIIIGILFVIGGLSGRFALFGTNSPEALAAVGLIPIAMGAYQLYNNHKRRSGR
jgi:hypothetical protein